ncbi:unnamed protein product, partial [Prunus brigantina]
MLHNPTPHSPRCYKNQTLAFSHSQFFSSNSFLRLKKQSLVSALQINKRQRTRRYRSVPVVFATQSNFLKDISHFFVRLFNSQRRLKPVINSPQT